MSAADLLDASLESAIRSACDAIAPTWPLDRFIAVNPWWGWIDRPFETAAAELTRLSGAHTWMPLAYYADAYGRGEIRREHVAQALDERASAQTPQELVQALARHERPSAAPPLLSDVVDEGRDLAHEPAWRDVITHQISQFCAAYFDEDQSDWRPTRAAGLYAEWRRAIPRDHGLHLLMSAPHVIRRARTLPDTAHALIQTAVRELGVPQAELADLLRAVLLRINGWAAWCAYLRWQAHLEGRTDDHIRELLAIRLAWEWLLDDDVRAQGSRWMQWRAAWGAATAGARESELKVAPIWQRAHEIAYQTSLQRSLTRSPVAAPAPDVQAVFCIDVRSETFRRALEQTSPAVQTRGFAGFFGLPISYRPLGVHDSRPQTPGLIAPTLEATDSSDANADAELGTVRRHRLRAQRAWREFDVLPLAAFARVEALGLGYMPELLRRSLSASRSEAAHEFGLSQGERERVRPQLVATRAERIALAARVLRAMSLVKDLAPLVVLIGHGGQSANNPHAAGLDCGACGGQTGEVNARALAALLNDPEVRLGLAEQGVEIPAATHFVAALHNTTTDEIVMFDRALTPSTHSARIAALQRTFAAAGDRARAERASTLGLGATARSPAQLLRALQARANDWAQTRPEWGLAGNAAFIAAPRSRTRGLDLGGRVFLHDYDAALDEDNSVLELIMTAPMVVAHWINLQYYASTVDNVRYGSGNKVLHNVVGGRIGVFEGNNGDLRIGLPLQSLHDGERWRHAPLRLSVFIEAKRGAIDAVLQKHAAVRQLVRRRWVHLFAIEPGTGAIEPVNATANE